MADLSPMMKQYLEIKKQHKDEILFYRIGDFYEMFFDDAITASRELDLTLTGKQCGLEERAPMCGVPFHSYETYMARLIAKGYKVAICEQVEDPATAKGLVKRDIVRVVTPGTVIESSMLQDDRNNYIASLFLKGDEAGVCFADISTGTAHVTQLKNAKIGMAVIAELCRYHPSEALVNTGVLSSRDVTNYIKKHMSCAVELMEDEQYAPGLIDSILSDQFGRDWASTTEIGADGLVRFAMGGLLQYLHDTQIKGVGRLKTVIRYTEAQYMHLPGVTRSNLELTETMRGREKRGTLLWVLDKTSTAMGKRLLRSWLEQPLVSSEIINHRLNAVECLVKHTVTRGEMSEVLHYITDIERLMTRTVYGSATPKEIYIMAQTFDRLPELKKLAQDCGCQELSELAEKIDPLEDIKARIYAAVDPDAPSTLKDGGVIAAGYNQEVDELRSIRENTKSVLARLEARLRDETGIPKLKIGFNHVFGYYIEVSNSYKNMVPDNYTRKQTLTNGERYITPELKELENKILGAHERLISLEHQLFAELLDGISRELDRIQQTARAVARLDVFVSLATVAADNNYCRPVVDDSDQLVIREGRHPVVEQVLKGSLFVPNDTLLDCRDNRCLIITGPNMAGKSTYMRQNALIALMAQIGSFVPASECHVGIVDAVFTRVGASDDLAAGQSTFMVEMTEVAEILKSATRRSLVILDEIGRGTSTFDGMSIARAVVEHIADPATGLGCKTLFATHYHELTDLEGTVEGVKNYNIAVKKRGEDITFLRRIVRGPADDSYGIEVAKLAGLPGSVTRRAHEVLRRLEASAPKNKVEQMDFGTLEDYQSPAVPRELMDKLEALDLETLTPIEALNFLYELKKTLKGSLSG
ncbi:DNA mismatch repair protein MutS [Faecalibacterium sp. An121]|uniref:DNA mismatch repair protein MutS n=1 Tax=Faecalibacterium sp. An121 TaxID=1965550 RepID=UPI000B38E36E|nr:DNA mismatch repair protein MutS [Faecalibacterium sp. An121]OUQ40269.1 DNA mismatch repair protein MutS [Faecalibacterium sp. An121]